MTTSLAPIDRLAPGANLSAYVQAVGGIPVLSQDQERALAEDFFYNDNLDAARQLVMSHLRFVVHIARSYNGYGLPEADLIQEGNVGLMKAVRRFDPTRGVRLVSFAVHWIKAEIHEFILRNWRIVKIATTKAQRKLFFNLRGQKKQLGWLSQTEAEAIAADLNVSVKDVQSMEGRLAAFDTAFEAPSDSDSEDGWQAPVNYLEDGRQDPAVLAEEEDWQGRSEQKLQLALADLDARSQDIVARRWLADEKATLHELAEEYGVSAERIRQLEQNAMKKLRASMEA
jgi:RNA polymerase sigma-32 factor